MEQDKILTHVYVVEVEQKQQDKDNSNDVCNIHSGVLRVFANKDDAMAYMREYYDEYQLTSKNIETFENGKGDFYVKVNTTSENIPSSVAISGEKYVAISGEEYVAISGEELENRICITKVSCYAMEITTSFDKENISVVEDYYDENFQVKI